MKKVILNAIMVVGLAITASLCVCAGTIASRIILQPPVIEVDAGTTETPEFEEPECELSETCCGEIAQLVEQGN